MNDRYNGQGGAAGGSPVSRRTAEDVIAELARQGDANVGTPKQGAYLDAAPYLVLRDADGKERVEWLHGVKMVPARKTGIVKLNDAASFILYYGTHNSIASFDGVHVKSGAAIYATMKPARFVAVLNDHHATGAGHRDHRADFTVAYSPEWDVWNKHNGHEKAFGSSEAFALFLEDNAPDIIKPDAAQMLNIALNFRIKADVAFSVAQRLQDGYVEFGYANLVSGESRNADGNKIKIPEQFVIQVPVFAGLDAPRYKVEARFRYRLKDGVLKLWYELVRPHKVLEQAFKDVWEKIAKETKAPMLHGDPG